jgi:hypothetical protein
MVRSLNTAALGASALLLAISFWNRNNLPASIDLQPQLANEPRQTRIAKKLLAIDYAGVHYSVEPQYEYELFGMVVSYRQHDGESRMHRMANDHLNVADLCVVWSDTAFSPHLDEIRFWNGIFTCNFQTSDREAWASIKVSQISNNHLLSADDAVRERVADVRIGDQVRIRGWLASYGSGAGRRGTSTTREDSGDGACETILVEEFDILEPAFGRWRVATYASLALLAIGLFVHFRLPYRPYS